jgi:hypothetical protein
MKYIAPCAVVIFLVSAGCAQAGDFTAYPGAAIDR